MSSKHMKESQQQVLKVRSLIFTLLAFAVIVMAIIPLHRTQLEAEELAVKYRKIQEENEDAIAEHRQAFQMAKQLEDPAFLADVARRDYYYSLPGEIIFELGDDVSRDGLSH